MADSRAVKVAKAVTSTIEDHRKANGFPIVEFVAEWDFETRPHQDDLSDDKLHVRVIVPRKYLSATRGSRETDGIHWIGQYDIDVRQKLTSEYLDSNDEYVKARLSKLTKLVEEIHLLFFNQARPITDINVDWVDKVDGKESEVLALYNTQYMQAGQFYGVCRELFQVTV